MCRDAYLLQGILMIMSFWGASTTKTQSRRRPTNNNLHNLRKLRALRRHQVHQETTQTQPDDWCSGTAVVYAYTHGNKPSDRADLQRPHFQPGKRKRSTMPRSGKEMPRTRGVLQLCMIIRTCINSPWLSRVWPQAKRLSRPSKAWPSARRVRAFCS